METPACVRPGSATPHEQAQDHNHNHEHQHDHNLRAAYLYVVADVLTSVLAIVALFAGKYLGANWLDPAMGIVGAILVARWSYGLIREISRVLLDNQADEHQLVQLRESIEAKSADRVADLHVWNIGHGIFAAEIAIQSEPPRVYRRLDSVSRADKQVRVTGIRT